MIPLRQFEEFVERGVVARKTPDILRADSLVKEAEKRRRFIKELLEKIKISDENANYYVESSYDAVMELLRAKLLTDGYKSQGEGAHEAEVSYLRKLGFSEHDVRFMNGLRFNRNGIKYYGKSFDKHYAESAVSFLNTIYPKLKGLLKQV
ncbi:hypothetical protein KY347_02720 [Candidatus Woesearchaeota archaeon]|nr:hypothetical protein [Candidatus Woesearchaeota archaeon]